MKDKHYDKGNQIKLNKKIRVLNLVLKEIKKVKGNHLHILNFNVNQSKSLSLLFIL